MLTSDEFAYDSVRFYGGLPTNITKFHLNDPSQWSGYFLFQTSCQLYNYSKDSNSIGMILSVRVSMFDKHSIYLP